MTLNQKYNIKYLLTFNIKFLLIHDKWGLSMQDVIPVFFYTIVLIFSLVPLANKIGLVDMPNARKKHIGATPLVGGIAIYIIVSGYFLLFLPHTQNMSLYLLSGGLLVAVGVLDDFFDIRVRYRLFIQFLCAFMIVVMGGMYFEDFGNIFGFGMVELGILGAVLTIIFIVANINAYNMIDGIDGLLGTLSLVSFVTLALLMSINSSSLAIVPIVISSTIIAYLVFNFSILKMVPKIFIGDAGAMLLGFTICWLIIIGSVVEDSFRPVMALYIVAVPIFDLLFNVISRVRRGVSPVKPGRDHIHHRLMRRGYTSRQTLAIISMFALFVSAMGVLGELVQTPVYIMAIGIILLYILYSNYFSKVDSVHGHIQPAE